jgi:hypothetical protein
LIAVVSCLAGPSAVSAQDEASVVPKAQPGAVQRVPASTKVGQAVQPEIVVVRKAPSGPQQSSVFGITPWVEWTMTATSIRFDVRQPGCYAAKWGRLHVRSNSAVVVDFEGFGDLVTVSTPRPVPWEMGTAPPLSPVSAVNFVPAATMNSQDIRLSREEAIDFQRDLWGRVTVGRESTSGDYIRKASIVLVLETARDWEESTDLIGTEWD